MYQLPAARVTRYGLGRLSSRLARAVPWLGVAVALASVASVVRRKGPVKGVVDSALNAVPIVGPVKTAVEALRGRDFLSDRVSTHSAPSGRTPGDLR